MFSRWQRRTCRFALRQTLSLPFSLVSDLIGDIRAHDLSKEAPIESQQGQ